MRKIILFLLILCLTLPAYSVCAVGATVSAGVVSGDCGDIVSVPIILSGNTGFVSLGVEIGYDSDALELVAVSQNQDVGGNSISSSKLNENPYNINWYSVSDIDFNGSVAEFKFRILAESGSHTVTVDFYKGVNGDYTDGEDVNFDEDFNGLDLTYSDGSITVIQKAGAVISDRDQTDKTNSDRNQTGKINSDRNQTGKINSDRNQTDKIKLHRNQTDKIDFTVSITENIRGILVAAVYDKNMQILRDVKMVPAQAKTRFAFDEVSGVVKVFWVTNGLFPVTLTLN